MVKRREKLASVKIKRLHKIQQVHPSATWSVWVCFMREKRLGDMEHVRAEAEAEAEAEEARSQ